MSTVAVIPARGGSRRIPRKNIRSFRGRPILAWSIEAARDSGCFDRIVVSTEDDEIAAVAERCGAEVPFCRPRELADDHTGTDAVFLHALGELSRNGADLEQACCLYATAPFVTGELLRHGRDVLRESGASSAFTVTEFEFPIQRALRIRHDGQVEMLWPEHRISRSQDLEPTFHDAGQFYWVQVEPYLAKGDVLRPTVAPIRIPRYRVQDIDTLDDWRRAELMHAALAGDG